MEETVLPSAGDRSPRLVEVVAAFSLATDLGLGQPLEHGLRSCLIATRLAEGLGIEDSDRDTIFWASLLAMVGCTAGSSELAAMFGDDIELRAGLYEVGPSPMAVPRYFISRAGARRRPAEWLRAGQALVTGGLVEGYVADCQLTAVFAERLGLGSAVSGALQHRFARWDAHGVPAGVGGEEISLAARMLCIAWRMEEANRRQGADGARELLLRHSGLTLDPNIVAEITPLVGDVLAGLEGECWEAVVGAEPARAALAGEAFDSALEALSDFADLKSRWFRGHSRAVAELAEGAAWRLGLDDAEVVRLRRAALVHSLGRTGVPTSIWDKPGPLSVSERERVQLYPYLTDRILRRGSLAGLAEIAAASQERLDGTGYARSLAGASIPLAARILAAADVYQALCEERPHRPAHSADEAAAVLSSEVEAGRLDGSAADAVLTAAGHRAPRRSITAPAGLTDREVEVLRLIAQGQTSAQAAKELGIRTKTVGTHIEHIYSKVGVSNRSAATMFALEHGLV